MMALFPANEGFQRTLTERLLISEALTSRGDSGVSAVKKSQIQKKKEIQTN